MLLETVNSLSPRERLIMNMRFGLGGETEHTQKEVADILGISQSYISRLEKRIIARLKKEMSILEDAILNGKDIRTMKEIEKHADWVEEWKYDYFINKENIHSIIQDEIGKVFVKVLECAGVYKRTEEGKEAFLRFVESL